MGTAFEARFPGKCADCLEWFPEDTRIRYNADNKIVHEYCEDDVASMDDVAEMTCPQCHLIHAGECP